MIMKCSVCGAPAIIKIKRHNVKFCKYHFDQHVFKQVKRAIDDFNMITTDL